MKKVEANDVWRRIPKKHYSSGFDRINFNGLNGLGEILFSKGMTAICGLNGVGKSTIISAIKDLIGIKLTEQDRRKVGNHTVSGIYLVDNHPLPCSNELSKRLSDQPFPLEHVAYADCTESVNIQGYVIRQANFEELLEQFEPYSLDEEEIETINYIIGKEYDSCSITEMEDIDGDGTVIPYFNVQSGMSEYDSASMGVGEHFLLYLFWRIKRIEEGTLLIIEEPETFISILSQEHLINVLGERMLKKGVKVILTTHSPYILRNIPNSHVRILSRMGEEVVITSADGELVPEVILGLEPERRGTIFVEDQNASDLLLAILNDRAPHVLRQYSIDVVGGHADISTRLKFPKSAKIRYNFIGIYDGDMRNRLSDTDDFHWNYCFLPGNEGVEDMLRRYLRSDNNLTAFCKRFNKSKEVLITLMSPLTGLDGHDWFHGLRTALSVPGYELINVLYEYFLKNDESIKDFITALQNCIDD